MVRVIVVGGGIGGLALASGLRRRGIDVVVFERDTDVAATGGYHITLDPRAQEALRGLVAPEVFERLLASASGLWLRERDAFWDRRGRLLGRGPDLAGDTSVDVDRVTLRTLLAEAAGGDLCLGRTVVEVVDGGEGTPRVVLEDGASVGGDVVVGADGTHSLVARCLAGGPTNGPAGLVGFSGRTLASSLGSRERRRWGPRSGLVIGGRGAALYVGFLDPVGRAALDRPELCASVTRGPTYVWGAMFPESGATEALRGLRGGELRSALVGQLVDRGWSERVVEVLERADPGSVAAYRFHAASSRARELAPWPVGAVTALGDAVHATPPTSGMGAGTAIRDAASLVENLGAVEAGGVALTCAVGRFEEGMRGRGAEVVARGMSTVRAVLATDTVWGAAATSVTVPLLAAITRARHRRGV